MLAFISAILALPGALSQLISQIAALVVSIEKSNSIALQNKVTQTVSVDLPAAKTAADLQNVNKEIQSEISGS